MAEWRTTHCSYCSGYGMTARGDGEAQECSECGGDGRLWLLPTGQCFMYPGGPARGSWPSEYVKATPVVSAEAGDTDG
jgi:hypothetical protein